MLKINKNSDWKKILKPEFKKNYFKKIESFLEQEKKAWKIIYPENKNIFKALNKTEFKNTKVIILWQDPYHGENQAHGLSFSVKKWVKVPPSLRNIFKEIESDLNMDKSKSSWNLKNWAEDWVLLLNSVLTVEKEKPASHSKIWWDIFYCL